MGLGPSESHSITQSLQAAQSTDSPANANANANASGSNGNGKDKDKGKGKEKAEPEPEQEDSREMTARYMGMVVIPGQYVAKIEVEEFMSQVRGRKSTVAGPGEGGSGSSA